MLILTRRVGESVVIDGGITITVQGAHLVAALQFVCQFGNASFVVPATFVSAAAWTCVV